VEHPLTAARSSAALAPIHCARHSARHSGGSTSAAAAGGSGRSAEEPHAEDWRDLARLRDEVCNWIERRGVDPNEAQDVAQEALIRAARYRARLLDERLLRPWVLSIARNVLVDRQRRACRELRMPVATPWLDGFEGREADPALDAEPDQIRFADQRLPREEVLRELHGALQELRDHDRDVLRCYYGFHGAEATCRETAAAWNLAPEVVKMRLFRARRRLLRSLRTRLGLGAPQIAGGAGPAPAGVEPAK
jgi:RNA polymerase sigma factor (sigma-70 family)